MSHLRGFVVVCACALIVSNSGCAALSLFSEDHKHIYENPDTQARINALESRVNYLEQNSHAPVIEPEGFSE